MTARRVLALAVALVLTLAGPAGAVSARTSLPDLEDEVMCVSCGIPLNIAESPQATDERNAIRAMVAKGYTKAQVKAELVSTYGPRVLADPGHDGFNLTSWLVPTAVLLAALAIVATFLVSRRGPARGAAPAAAGPALSASDARRLDEDLARFDR